MKIPSITELPYEIVELIATHLSRNDLLHMILVSRSWYKIFNKFIYQTIIMDDYGLKERILKAIDHGYFHGKAVQKLTLKNIMLQEEEINKVTLISTHLDTLYLDWKVWSNPTLFEDMNKVPASWIRPPQGLPSIISNFFKVSCLSHLTIDASNQETADIWTILSLTPRLNTLRLMNLNYEHIITLGYMETIHGYCPELTELYIKCNRSDPNPAYLTQFVQGSGQIKLNPTHLKSFSLTSKSGSAKWPLWLPYFSVKYPCLKHMSFKHSGFGKDGVYGEVPDRIFSFFADKCSLLESVEWKKILVNRDDQQRLFDAYCRDGRRCPLKKIEAYEDFSTPEAMTNSPIIQTNSLMTHLLTSLTIGQPPTDVRMTEIMAAMGHCRNLYYLRIQGWQLNSENSFQITTILNNCRHLIKLYIKDTVIDHEKESITVKNHPLKTLILKRSSFVDGVFESISLQCPHLNHLEITGCFQSDRRDQIIIYLPNQHLKVVDIQGLRARNYYTGCRVRYFSVKTNIRSDWYYMTQYDVKYHPVGRKVPFKKFRNMEYACRMDRLDEEDVQELKALVTTKTMKAWDIEAISCNLRVPHTATIDKALWDPENLYYSGLVNIQCGSINHLVINDKAIK
ncbi:hypothetical protein BDB01DRAFT_584455 [Pilobolus umbonatus]|nr:hypothetical protein BDB01DRAFT_584455 [Pilobolus umbonatus]